MTRHLSQRAQQGSPSRALRRMRPLLPDASGAAPSRKAHQAAGPAGGHASLAEQIRTARASNPAVEFWLDSHPRIHAPDTLACDAVADTLGHYGESAAGSGQLAAQLTGVTTNPILIEEYDAVVRQRTPASVPRSAANRDTCYHTHIASAAEAMSALHRASDGRYGWVSAQVSPAHTFDTRAIVDEGLRLAALADNVMVKVPGSQEGYRAIEHLVGCGVSVNGTLSFSLAQFETFAVAVAAGRGRLSGSENDRVRTVVTHMTGRVGDAVRAFSGPAPLDIRSIRLAEAVLARRGAELVGEIEPRSSILLSSVRVDPGAAEECLHLTATLDKPVAYTIKPETYVALECVDTAGVFRGQPGLLDEVDAVGITATHELIRPLFNRNLPPDQFWAIPQFLQTLAEASSSHLKLIGGVHAA
ncbi:MAG TPA: transaldolase family protein [Jatrophihabitans sp.]|uniref:transaldolase family protein n=1 Tax=Jatrophihabitans sp. TaxID=1932789 RepID=UPI002EE15BDA